MSRIGKAPIKLPNNVTVDVSKTGAVQVKGPEGILSQYIDPAITVKVEGDVLGLTRKSDQKSHKALHGLYRALINNMVIGVSQGYTKELELVGVGYKINVQGDVLEFSLGYSHSIFLVLPPEVSASTEVKKDRNPVVQLKSVDKQLIGQVAAKIKSLRKVEPYGGKGIKLVGEWVRRKVRKAAGRKK